MRPAGRHVWPGLTQLVVALLWGVASHVMCLADEPPASQPMAPSAAQVDYFETHIRPVLVAHCYDCHAADSDIVQGGLLLDTRDGIRRGGDSGPAVVPGEPDSSLLLSALRYEDYEMPPDGPLPDDVIARFAAWIEAGAADPRDGLAADASRRSPAPDMGTDFWAFQTPRGHARPQVMDGAWPRTEIDWYILRGIEQAGLRPAAEADRRTLLRRVTFDLIGLPPTPSEVRAFLADSSPQAYERVVDRLLASPHYGERWARLWMDVARYAEDQAHIVGNDRSLCYPNAFLYRDWLIAAWNDDVPYDRFLQLQLAADLMADAGEGDRAALGFLGLGPKYYNRGSPQVKADEWDDRIDTVTRGLMGLTVACARCHDHKFDPITMHDYYALAGVFASTQMYNCPLDDTREQQKNGQAKNPEDALHIVREGKPVDIALAIRGDVSKPGPRVPRRFLTVLQETSSAPFVSGSGRLELAAAITSRRNPLTARVLVNRIWAAHFGRPLVATPSNFGTKGGLPTHPELLDDLAVRFMERGNWSLKWLHREMVLSATYRQASDVAAGQEAADPENHWYSRMHRRRLSVEAWRDALLVASGQLDRRVGGRSLDPAAPESRRRTVYAEIHRLQLNSLLALFDFPDPNFHAAGRTPTTTPLQKLFVMNSPFVVAQAEHLAQDLEVPGDGDPRGAPASPAEPLAGTYKPTPDSRVDRVQRYYLRCFGRRATDEELDLARQFLQDSSATIWRDFAQALLAANEMMFVD